MSMEKIKSRSISDKIFFSALEDGSFEKLFVYLRNNKDKYNLTVRNDLLELYSHGRKLTIEHLKSSYKISFNMNNADRILVDNPDLLGDIIANLKDLNFDTKGYIDWKDSRLNYISMKDKEYKKAPQLTLSCKIPNAEIREYDFKKLLDVLYPIFASYAPLRAEENFRQKCISVYDTDSRNPLIFDVEYKPPFKNSAEKKKYLSICKPNTGGKCQFFKPDLVALKKVGDYYHVEFIELKVNISASVGKDANIIDHIIDWQNYKELYRLSAYERQSFKETVVENLRFKARLGLIDCEDVENIISKTVFTNPPELSIVCALIRESEEDFRKKLKSKIDRTTLVCLPNLDVPIKVGKNDPEVLTYEGIPLGEYIEKESTHED